MRAGSWALVWLCATAHAAAATPLGIVTRDGVLHWLDDGSENARQAGFAKPAGLGAHGRGELAVLSGDTIQLVARDKKPKSVPGRYKLLAGDGRVVALDTTGTLCELVERQCRPIPNTPKIADARLLAVDGANLFVERGGVVDEIGPTPHSFKIQGRPIAIAAAAGKLYVATREGPLWAIDRKSGDRHDLGLGGWWGTLDMTARGDALYVVTQAGKLWEISVGRADKQLLTQGTTWEGAYAITIVR